ncbi:aromatic amino acid lyase [Hymenobacter bucti]|uniref:Aromatic amino acid lyase n=1 Tax=Hymenobacter bucti TaxID=1844114 RepID=A0ABW4QRF5_9BACT
MPHLSPHEPLTLAELASLLRSKEAVRLSPTAEQYLGAQPTPRASAAEEAPATKDLGASQEAASLLTALAVGTGPELPAALVRRLLLLAAYRLGRTDATAGPVVRRLLDFYSREVWPLVYEQGSLGAGHDQVPLAHLALPLLGLGEVNYQGYRLATADVLELFGWAPPLVSPALALGLLSGSDFTLAYATEALERAEHLLRAAAVIGVAPTADLAVSLADVRPVLEAACNAPGEPAPTSAELLTSPSTSASDLDNALNHLAHTAAQAGTQSAQRLAGLVAQPGHLAAEPAQQLGFLALPRAAASLVHLLNAGSSPLILSGAAAALGARRTVELTEQLLGLELLAAAQALDLRAPAAPDLGPAPAAALARAVAAFREHVTFAAHDRVLAPDLHRAARFVREYAWA